MDYKKRSHSVYLLTYHIVFVTKWRKPVINDEIGDFIRQHCAYLCGPFEGELISAETDRDHVHLVVSIPPDVAPSALVRTLKTQTSKEIHQYKELDDYVKQYIRGCSAVVAVILHCDDRRRCHGEGKRVHRVTAYG